MIWDGYNELRGLLVTIHDDFVFTFDKLDIQTSIKFSLVCYESLYVQRSTALAQVSSLQLLQYESPCWLGELLPATWSCQSSRITESSGVPPSVTQSDMQGPITVHHVHSNEHQQIVSKRRSLYDDSDAKSSCHWIATLNSESFVTSPPEKTSAKQDEYSCLP